MNLGARLTSLESDLNCYLELNIPNFFTPFFWSITMQFFSKKSNSLKRANGRRQSSKNLSYDSFEKRELLAGDVEVVLYQDYLYIRGDMESNQIQVRGTDNGTIEIAGDAGTTINGSDRFRLENVNNRIGGIRVNLAAGDDSIFIENIQVRDIIRVLGGQGGDSIGFYKVNVEGDLRTSGGDGDDMISLDEVRIGRRLNLAAGQGADAIGIDRVDVGGQTFVATGLGDDRLSVRNSIHRNSAFLSAKAGNDLVSVDGVQVQGYAVINAGAGNDDVYVANSSISRKVFAYGGTGSDQLEVSSTTNLALTPRVIGFEGTDVVNEQGRSAAVFDDLIIDGARLGTILELATLNPNFSTLVGALQATGLTSALAGSGPFTVFAPLNSAFDKISSVVSGLTNQQLTDVLKFHVVNGAVNSSQLVMMSSVNTLLGQSFSVSTNGGNVVLNGNATLAVTDIRAKNGIIHVLNDVLVPVL